MLKIKLSGVIVKDQESALRFYTEVLGFTKKMDLPLGEHRWLTVVSPAEPDGTQLLLEPDANPASRAYQKALFESGIPLASFEVDDIGKEYERLKKLGVVFKGEPANVGTATIAICEDTCGNLLQIYQTT